MIIICHFCGKNFNWENTHKYRGGRRPIYCLNSCSSKNYWRSLPAEKRFTSNWHIQRPDAILVGELWKGIPNEPYEVSSVGRVRRAIDSKRLQGGVSYPWARIYGISPSAIDHRHERGDHGADLIRPMRRYIRQSRHPLHVTGNPRKIPL